MSRMTAVSSRSEERLGYVIELCAIVAAAKPRVLARAVNSQLAREIFKAAILEYPQRRIVLRKAGRIIADSGR
jgi:hypothetical protein